MGFRFAGVLVLIFSCGCSIQRVVVDRVGDALSRGSGGYAEDDDPELVRDASPFALKAVESLLSESPNNKGLLLASCSGFTQYAHAFVQDEADYTEAADLARATAMRARAKKLYLRAREYGLRGLDAAVPGFREQLKTYPERALARVSRDQVPMLYYTAASWAAAFALDVSDANLAVDQSVIELMIRRAFALDPNWDGGALHEFLLAWEAGHAQAGGSAAAGEPPETQRPRHNRWSPLQAGLVVGLATVAVLAAICGWLGYRIPSPPFNQRSNHPKIHAFLAGTAGGT